MSDGLQVTGVATCAALTASSSRIALPVGDVLQIAVNSVASGLGAWINMGTIDTVAAVGTASTAAAATLTSTGVFGNNETVTIGTQVYTFKTALTGGGVTANEVLIGADQTASHLNLLRAVNKGAGGGTLYGSATVLHASVTAASSDGTHTVFAAKLPGSAGNAIASTETVANASFGGAVFASGADGDQTSIYVSATCPVFVRREPAKTHLAAIGAGANAVVNIVGLS